MPTTSVRPPNWTKLAIAIAIATSTWAIAESTTAPTTAPSTAPAEAENSAPTTTVKRGDLNLALDFKGVFEPVQPFEVRLNPRRYHDEFIVTHVVEPGTKVSKGDVLLQLDTDKIDTAIAAAQNDLNIAQANLAKAQADLRLGKQSDALAMSSVKQNLVDSQTSLKRWDEVDGPNTQLANSMGSRISDFEVESATDELNELKKMYKSEDLTSETADIVMKRAIRVLDLQKLINKTNHTSYDRFQDFEFPIVRRQMSDGVDQQTIGVDQLNAAQVQGADLRQAAVVTAQAAKDEAQKNLDELKRDRELFSISSGVDGVVVYGSFKHKAWTPIDPDQLSPGEKVQPSQILLTVYQPGRLNLTTECPEDQLTYFTAGTKVTVTPQSLPDLTYGGACHAPPAVADSGQVFNIRVDLPTVDNRLAPGYAANVNLNAGKRADVLLVPTTAVWRNKVWVTTPNSKTPEPRLVTVGATDGKNIEIKSGLTEGDTVLTQAPHAGGQ
jgi:HlyD family secretion protein